MYSKKIGDEEFYEQIIMSRDFMDRTVIKIITENNFEALLDEKDPKAERVMGMIWLGKEAALCDGDIMGYSNLFHIIQSKTKRVNDRREGGTSLMDIVTNFFQFNRGLNYDFQYRFRTQSIQFYFLKEFICAFLMLVIFQYINLRYLALFSKATLFSLAPDGTPMDPLVNVENSIKEYWDWSTPALVLSGALIF
jgi:hypothetical protein